MSTRHKRENERLKRLYSALCALNQTVMRASSREELLHDVCRIVTEQAGFKLAWVGSADPDTHKVVPLARAGDGEHYVDVIEVFTDDRPEGRGPVGTCIRAGRPCVFNDFLNDPLGAPWRTAAAAHGLLAVAALPIRVYGGVYGALTVYDSEPNVFQDEEIGLLKEVAAGVSLALERLDHEAERYRVEEALRAANRAAEASRAGYEQVVSMISDITWRYEVDGQGQFVNSYISPVADRLLGLPAGSIGNDLDKYFSHIPAEDLPAVQETLASGLKSFAKDATVEYRLRRPDGTTLWVRTKGSAYFQADGHVAAFGTTSDISDRKRAEEALRQSEERYRRLFEVESDAILIVDAATGRFLDVNSAASNLYGYARDEFLCLRVGDISAEPDKTYAAIADQQTTIHGRWHRKKDGTVFPVDIASSYFDCQGRSIHVSAIRDVTEREQAQAAIQRSEHRYRSLFNEMTEGFALHEIICDEHGKPCDYRFLDLNATFEQLTGLNRHEVVGKTMREVLPEEAPDWIETYGAVALTGQSTRFERYSATLGKHYDVYAYCPAPRQFATIFTDVTARKRAEDALKKNEAMLSGILNSIPLSIFWKDCDSIYLGCNETFAQGAGCRPQDAVGNSDFALSWSREDSEAYRADDRAVMASGRARTHIIERQHRPDGSYIWLDTTKIPLLDADGKVCGVVGVYDDITERKRMEDELRKAKDAADAANRAKSEFLANMSHEIRTPMTAVLGFADMLVESVLCCDECPKAAACQRRLTGREAVSTIRRNGEHLMQVIGDILDLSKIEADKVQIEAAPCSPVQLAAEVVSLMRPQAAAKQLILKTELAGPLPETVMTDPLRLRQVLVNLVGNAIKFTDQGEVCLVVRFTAESGSPRLWFDVIDTGIGMNEEQMKSLFQPFSQVDSSSTRKFGGTGLGLCISKHLAEAMGGSITVRSTPGSGSVFSVAIDPGPLAELQMLQNAQEALLDCRPSATSAPAEKIVLRGRILLAEDGPDNQRLICLLLGKAGAEVTAVDNGQLAVEAALAARAAGEAFDVILMDMQMSVMDGYTATRELRKQGYTAPIIALTAHAMADDCRKCLEAGCDGYAAKPIDRKTLLATVAPWLAGGGTPSNTAAAAERT
jgi:PAS domain S-box-containing protein